MTTTTHRKAQTVKDPVTIERRVLLALINAADQSADMLREKAAEADTTLERRKLMNRVGWIQKNANDAYDAAHLAPHRKEQ